MIKSEYEPVIKQARNDPYAEFILEMGDGREFNLDIKLKHYASLAAIDSMYGPFEILEDIDKVPIEIAVEGNAALATYLIIVYEAHYDLTWKAELRRVADILDVKRYTVTKYLGRVRDRL
jgi:hypothetical protein